MLKSTGPISISDLQKEFSGNSSLKSYYRGGPYVGDSWYNRSIPTSGLISLSQFYYSFKGWDTGVVGVIAAPTWGYTYDPIMEVTSYYYANGLSSVTIPKITQSNGTTIYSPSFLIQFTGGWGQSNEDGRIYVTDASGNELLRLLEGAAAIVPPGKTLYRVSTNGALTAVSVFPDQAQANHVVYVEIENVPNMVTFNSLGAPPQVSNPTTFYNVRMRTNFTRASILSSMGAYDQYYLVA